MRHRQRGCCSTNDHEKISSSFYTSCCRSSSISSCCGRCVFSLPLTRLPCHLWPYGLCHHRRMGHVLQRLDKSRHESHQSPSRRSPSRRSHPQPLPNLRRRRPSKGEYWQNCRNQCKSNDQTMPGSCHSMTAWLRMLVQTNQAPKSLPGKSRLTCLPNSPSQSAIAPCDRRPHL